MRNVFGNRQHTLILIGCCLLLSAGCRDTAVKKTPSFEERRVATIEYVRNQFRYSQSMSRMDEAQRSREDRYFRNLLSLLESNPDDRFVVPKLIEVALIPLDSGGLAFLLRFTYLQGPSDTTGFYLEGNDISVQQDSLFNLSGDCNESDSYLLLRDELVLLSTVGKANLTDGIRDRFASRIPVVQVKKPLYGLPIKGGLLSRTGKRSPHIAVTQSQKTAQQSEAIRELNEYLYELHSKKATPSGDYLIAQYERAIQYLKDAQVPDLGKPRMLGALLFTVESSDRGEFVLRVDWLEEGFRTRQCVVFQGNQEVARSELLVWQKKSELPRSLQEERQEIEGTLLREREFRVVTAGSSASTQPAEESPFGDRTKLVIPPGVLDGEFSVSISGDEGKIEPVTVFVVHNE